MNETSEKMTEILSLRLSSTMRARLQAVADESGLRVPEIARNAIYDEIERMETPAIPADLKQLLTRCGEYDIDVKTVLHTALVEEQCSSITHREVHAPKHATELLNV